MKKLVISVAAFTLLFGTVLAQGPFGNRGSKPGNRGITNSERGGRLAQRNILVITEYLGLDENQLSELNRLMENRKNAVETVFQSIREDGDGLRALMDSNDPDPAAVGNLVISMHNHRLEIKDIQSSFVSGFKALLTPEQLSLYEQVLERTRHDRIVPAFHSLRLFEDSGFNEWTIRGKRPDFGRGPGPGPGHGFGPPEK